MDSIQSVEKILCSLGGCFIYNLKIFDNLKPVRLEIFDEIFYQNKQRLKFNFWRCFQY